MLVITAGRSILQQKQWATIRQPLPSLSVILLQRQRLKEARGKHKQKRRTTGYEESFIRRLGNARRKSLISLALSVEYRKIALSRASKKKKRCPGHRTKKLTRRSIARKDNTKIAKWRCESMSTLKKWTVFANYCGISNWQEKEWNNIKNCSYLKKKKTNKYQKMDERVKKLEHQWPKNLNNDKERLKFLK